MKTILALVAAILATMPLRANPPAIIALEGEVFHVGKTGLRIVSSRWHDPSRGRLESEGGEQYVKIATEKAGYYEGKKIAIYVYDGGTIEWSGRTFKKWVAIDPATLPKGFSLAFPSEYGR